MREAESGRRLFFEIWQKRWGARESAPAAVGVPPKAFDLGDASHKVNRFGETPTGSDRDGRGPAFQRHGSGEGPKLR